MSRPLYTLSEAQRADFAEALLQRASEVRRSARERRELRAMARRWIETLKEGPRKDRIVSLDERLG